MKKVITIFILAFILNNLSSQTNDRFFESAIYSVGNEKMGYANKLFVCEKEDIVACNGTSVPALSYFINNKKDFIGGILINENNKKTKIKNLYLEKKNNIIFLKIVGYKFTRHIGVEPENYFLDFDYSFAKFYTSEFGIWSIYKKKL